MKWEWGGMGARWEGHLGWGTRRLSYVNVGVLSNSFVGQQLNVTHSCRLCKRHMAIGLPIWTTRYHQHHRICGRDK